MVAGKRCSVCFCRTDRERSEAGRDSLVVVLMDSASFLRCHSAFPEKGDRFIYPSKPDRADRKITQSPFLERNDRKGHLGFLFRKVPAPALPTNFPLSTTTRPRDRTVSAAPVTSRPS